MAKTRKPAVKPNRPGADLRRERFIAEYLKDGNGRRAAIAAGYSESSAANAAHRLLQKSDIKAALAAGSKQLAENAGIEADEVLRLNWMKATADVNDLVRVQFGACRFCHGHNHAFHWKTRREFDIAFIAAAEQFWPTAKDDNPRVLATVFLEGCRDDDLVVAPHPGMPTLEGGIGYKHLVDPHKDCPECEGQGVETVRLRDTSTLSEAARALYEGAEVTKDGNVKIKIADRGAALDRVAKQLGVYKGELGLTPGGQFGSLIEAINDGNLGFTPKRGQIPKNALETPKP